MTSVEAPASGSAGSPADGELAERVAAAAVRCPGVAGLCANEPENVVTYRRGAPLRGVAVHDDEVVVCVVTTLERPVFRTAETVAATVAPLVGGRSVHVIVGDVIADDGRR
ncbi:hypothetical protein [Actinomadura rudentiformis]|uniref:Asp23/Gls24 family envelope stress response protein n=1 Tax=Actinomadura rudentiformis TaxID=359158 RepID=A0A6H9YSL2_9ACTN|nr:hypothetical protein [Actinomadura rudentiformis]KAB2347008.1 hypothetical protein F8566_22805 [Actinomadura rudentiformis]